MKDTCAATMLLIGAKGAAVCHVHFESGIY